MLGDEQRVDQIWSLDAASSASEAAADSSCRSRGGRFVLRPAGRKARVSRLNSTGQGPLTLARNRQGARAWPWASDPWPRPKSSFVGGRAGNRARAALGAGKARARLPEGLIFAPGFLGRKKHQASRTWQASNYLRLPLFLGLVPVSFLNSIQSYFLNAISACVFWFVVYRVGILKTVEAYSLRSKVSTGNFPAGLACRACLPCQSPRLSSSRERTDESSNVL